VLPIISKIIERGVHDQLYSYLTNNNLLNSCQSGFRKQHSTTTALLDVTDYILNNMDDGKVTGALFIDLKKAFDTVNSDIILHKLVGFGVTGIALCWFKSYLSGRTQTVSINSSLSDFKNIDIGVPQGSILGPLLFIIYVNSLPDCIDCKCVMYADDTTLLFTASDPTTLQVNMNESLPKIASWFKTNKLTLNTKKTKFMIFGMRAILRNFSNISINYGNSVIERVDKFKYLGVILDPFLSWSDHIDYVSTNISKRIGIIRQVKLYLPSTTLMMLANALVFPFFDYCSPVWSNCIAQYSKTLQILQNKLARDLLTADIRTSVDDLMASLNWDMLDKRLRNQLLLLVFKCLKNEAPSYLSSQFLFTSSIHSKNTRSQCSNTLVLPPFRIKPGKRTFHLRGSSTWNSLPADIRCNLFKLNVHTFKSNL